MSAALKTPRLGLDSTGPVSGAGHRSIGSTFAVRYVSRYTPKAITRSEADQYAAEHIGLAVVFEDGADNALKGHSQGQDDAHFALGQARAAGMPDGRPIYFAVDVDPTGREAETDPYFDGCRVVLGDRVGIYGSYTVVRRQMDRGLKWGWQAYAWSGGQRDPRAQLYQYSNDHIVAGVGVDYNRAYYEDFGQWGYHPVPPKPVDPHHYLRYPTGPFVYGKLKLNERFIVEEYDRLRKHPRLHRSRLGVLRSELSYLAKRAAYLAHQEHPHVSIAHALAVASNDRGWRFQGLAHRAQGRRLV